MRVRDPVTGLRRVTPADEDAPAISEVVYAEPLVIGTIREVTVGVEANCCERGVALRFVKMIRPDWNPLRLFISEWRTWPGTPRSAWWAPYPLERTTWWERRVEFSSSKPRPLCRLP